MQTCSTGSNNGSWSIIDRNEDGNARWRSLEVVNNNKTKQLFAAHRFTATILHSFISVFNYSGSDTTTNMALTTIYISTTLHTIMLPAR